MSHKKDPADIERIERGNAQMAGWVTKNDQKLAAIKATAEARKAASKKVREEIRDTSNQVEECAIVCALLESD